MDKRSKNELAGYRLAKAKERLIAAETLLEASASDSISRSYYAVFDAAKALLAVKGLDGKTHKRVISLFNIHYIKTEVLAKEFYQILVKSKANRERADYDDYVEYGLKEAREALDRAREFVRKVDEYLEEVDVLKRK